MEPAVDTTASFQVFKHDRNMTALSGDEENAVTSSGDRHSESKDCELENSRDLSLGKYIKFVIFQIDEM